METQTEQLIRYVREHGLVRPRELAAIDIPRSVLKRLVDRGRLVRRMRGIYSVPDYDPTENTDLASVASRAPKAIICLLSALRFHELTTQNPFQVWIMIDRAGHRPVIDHPPIRVVYASGRALTEGVGGYTVEGIDLRVTSPGKTVTDCFRYRRLVGTDVAIEALRDCWRQRKATMDEFYHYAKIDRVASFMRPYMESLV
ncbi:MAG: transcriptional regulator [Calditrichaeota bacterium]|nr:transcriptional regulator [Calditrichota bacterium]